MKLLINTFFTVLLTVCAVTSYRQPPQTRRLTDPDFAREQDEAIEWLRESKRKRMRKEDEYFIDGLIITTREDLSATCSSGGDHTIIIEGAIGPDSSFALGELLKTSPNCLDTNGNLISRTKVILNSLGGYVRDGYAMGRAIRDNEAATEIDRNSLCASACAIAFLGGVERIMSPESVIMFHAPYLPIEVDGATKARCDSEGVVVSDLNNYYTEMTNKVVGDRLFDRTMSYCSADDGWVLRGANSAELFGVATKI